MSDATGWLAAELANVSPPKDARMAADDVRGWLDLTELVAAGIPFSVGFLVTSGTPCSTRKASS